MSAADIIQNLLDAANAINDVSRASGGDWAALLDSPELASIEKRFAEVLGSSRAEKLDELSDAIEQKQSELTGGRAFTELSPDELDKYQALEKLHNEVIRKLLETPDRPSFLSVLVHDVLPVLVKVAEVVIPLLA